MQLSHISVTPYRPDVKRVAISRPASTEDTGVRTTPVSNVLNEIQIEY